MNAVKSERWLNKGNGGKEFFCTAHTLEHRKHNSESHKGSPRSIEYRKKISNTLKTKLLLTPRTHSEETKRKISLSIKGKTHSKETKEKMSKSRKIFLSQKTS